MLYLPSFRPCPLGLFKSFVGLWSFLAIFLCYFWHLEQCQFSFLDFNKISQKKRVIIAYSVKGFRYRCGRFGTQFPGRSNRTQCSQRLATAATFLWSCVAQSLSRGIGPCHLLPRFDATTNLMKRV